MLWLAWDSTIQFHSSITIRSNTNGLCGPLFDTEYEVSIRHSPRLDGEWVSWADAGATQRMNTNRAERRTGGAEAAPRALAGPATSRSSHAQITTLIAWNIYNGSRRTTVLRTLPVTERLVRMRAPGLKE